MTQENFAARAYNRAKDSALGLEIGTLMAITNAIDRQGMMVYANDPLGKQALLSLPSALPAPATTGSLAADIGIQVAETALTVEIVRRSSSTRQLLGTAAVAQLVSCGVDAVIERTGWLDAVERVQPDVGFSAISAAWFSKFFLDRADRAQTPLRKRLWQSGAAVYAGVITLGYFFLNEGSGGALDLSSHASGVAVGIGAHLFAKRRQAGAEEN